LTTGIILRGRQGEPKKKSPSGLIPSPSVTPRPYNDGEPLALTPGTRIGPYAILSALGAGGMGEVYRATDTRLKRQVAVKTLPPSVSMDPDRLARFQREAEVLATLNHPRIAAIYGLEDADGVKALVMELVEGEDLAQLRRSPKSMRTSWCSDTCCQLLVRRSDMTWR
jgi:serine/threonine protein kinase